MSSLVIGIGLGNVQEDAFTRTIHRGRIRVKGEFGDLRPDAMQHRLGRVVDKEPRHFRKLRMEREPQQSHLVSRGHTVSQVQQWLTLHTVLSPYPDSPRLLGYEEAPA